MTAALVQVAPRPAKSTELDKHWVANFLALLPYAVHTAPGAAQTFRGRESAAVAAATDAAEAVQALVVALAAANQATARYAAAIRRVRPRHRNAQLVCVSTPVTRIGDAS